MKCQSWRFVSLIGAAVKYGLGFLWRSLLSFRRRRVEGEDIFVFFIYISLYAIGIETGIDAELDWKGEEISWKMTVVSVLRGRCDWAVATLEYKVQ